MQELLHLYWACARKVCACPMHSRFSSACQPPLLFVDQNWTQTQSPAFATPLCLCFMQHISSQLSQLPCRCCVPAVSVRCLCACVCVCVLVCVHVCLCVLVIFKSQGKGEIGPLKQQAWLGIHAHTLPASSLSAFLFVRCQHKRLHQHQLFAVLSDAAHH